MLINVKKNILALNKRRRKFRRETENIKKDRNENYRIQTYNKNSLDGLRIEMKKERVSELEDRPKIILAEEETKTADKKKQQQPKRLRDLRGQYQQLET